jgi:hypothetical protein
MLLTVAKALHFNAKEERGRRKKILPDKANDTTLMK